MHSLGFVYGERERAAVGNGRITVPGGVLYIVYTIVPSGRHKHTHDGAPQELQSLLLIFKT